MLLKNCKIISTKEIISGDILIEGEKIAEIGKDLKDDDTIDIKGRPVIPGIVDVHVHMRDFKDSKKEDFYSGSRAALAGGVTTFIDMPNSNPPVIDVKTFEMRVKEAERRSIADFGINLGVTQDNLPEIGKIAHTACKVYMDGTLGGIDDETLKKAIENCRTVAFHAEDSETIERNMGYIDGSNFLLHGQVREPRAEEIAVKKVADIARKLEKRVHICHISCRKALTHLNNFTTSEATPHHLLLTETDLKEKKGVAKTNPPLRSHLDLRSLWDALKAGRIDIIASDHAPHEESEKEAGVFEAPPGIPNLDVMSRLFLTLVNKGTISLFDIVRLMCTNPARIFGIEHKGEIAVGKDADILILDMDEKGKIDVDEFYSKAKYSPFEGWKTIGKADTVILRGKVAYEDGEFNIRKGHGKMIGGKT
jgi:dihydroorotase